MTAEVLPELNMFCPELQKLLQFIYELPRKGRSFIWTDIHQNDFEEIKKRLLKPPVLYLQTRDNILYLQLYCNTNPIAVGEALYQIQSGKPRLTAYTSK